MALDVEARLLGRIVLAVVRRGRTGRVVKGLSSGGDGRLFGGRHYGWLILVGLRWVSAGVDEKGS